MWNLLHCTIPLVGIAGFYQFVRYHRLDETKEKIAAQELKWEEELIEEEEAEEEEKSKFRDLELRIKVSQHCAPIPALTLSSANREFHVFHLVHAG